MVAYADRKYLEVQLDAAIAARKRLEASAIKVFGHEEGPKILRRLMARQTAIIRRDNPDLLESPRS
jgi:hypothetical protein